MMDIPFVSDGCTGAQWIEWIWPATHECCALHDYGGSDLDLLLCWQAAGMPLWLAGVAIALMIAWRPLYEFYLTRIKHPIEAWWAARKQKD